MLSRFHSISEHNRQIDGPADGQKCYVSIACQHCCDDERKKTRLRRSRLNPHLADYDHNSLNVDASWPVHVYESVAVCRVIPEKLTFWPQMKWLQYRPRLKACRPIRLWALHKTTIKNKCNINLKYTMNRLTLSNVYFTQVCYLFLCTPCYLAFANKWNGT